MVSFLMRRFLKYWLPVLLWSIFIFAGSTDLMSPEHTSRFLVPFLRWLAPDISDSAVWIIQLCVRKGAHLVEYAVLTALLFRAFQRGRSDFWRTATLTLVAAIIYASLDEFHQTFVPSRTGMPWDVMVDSAGAIAALLLIRICVRRLDRRQTA